MDLWEFRMGYMNWIDLAEHINKVKNLGVPKSVWDFIY